MHRNPIVRSRHLRCARRSATVQLIEPLTTPSSAMPCQPRLILTDSGGVQEEAPASANPCS